MKGKKTKKQKITIYEIPNTHYMLIKGLFTLKGKKPFVSIFLSEHYSRNFSSLAQARKGLRVSKINITELSLEDIFTKLGLQIVTAEYQLGMFHTLYASDIQTEEENKKVCTLYQRLKKRLGDLRSKASEQEKLNGGSLIN